mmetsp:Transcript_29065/g.52682  ORF Transcript_29065/g.52682 Transcript_29065/m.52682 type:complete len:305 (-) Transcript_29065:249-1163(-)
MTWQQVRSLGLPMLGSPNGRLVIRNTFIDGYEISSDDGPKALRRSSSDPCHSRFANALTSTVALDFTEEDLERTGGSSKPVCDCDPSLQIPETCQTCSTGHISTWGCGTPQSRSLGSLGHPHLCMAPCRFLAKGSCSAACECEACHGDHPPHTTLDASSRKHLNKLSFGVKICLCLPILRSKAAKGGFADLAEKFVAGMQDQLEHSNRSCRLNDRLVHSFQKMSFGQVVTMVLFRSAGAPANPETLVALKEEFQNLRKMYGSTSFKVHSHPDARPDLEGGAGPGKGTTSGDEQLPDQAGCDIDV